MREMLFNLGLDNYQRSSYPLNSSTERASTLDASTAFVLKFGGLGRFRIMG